MTKTARSILAWCTAALVLAALVVAGPVTRGERAGTAPVAATTYNLRVGSFNVRSVQNDLHPVAGEQPWRVRRGAIVRDVLSEQLDVLGVQEASQNMNFASHFDDGANQYLDLVAGLNKNGADYALTNTSEYNCVRAWTNSRCDYLYRGASRDMRIIYNRNTLELVHGTSYLYRHQSGGLNDQRYLVTAVFRVKATGKQFFFATTHLAVGSVPLRRAQWQELISRVKAMRGSLPVVITGDYNTTKWQAPAGTMLSAMRNAGFGDVTNQRYQSNFLPRIRAYYMVDRWINSFNGFNRDVRVHAYEENHRKIGNNIDWIWATNSLRVQRWRVVVHYDPATLRMTGVIPSDHNLVTSTIVLP